MAIPILQNIDKSLADIFAGGSALARGAAELSGFVPALRQLGGKAPVFNALADRIEAAVKEATPEALMEAQLLVHSLRYTQGATGKGAGEYEARYAGNPLKTKEYPYLELKSLISRLGRGGRSGLKRELERMVEDGSYEDVRFFHAYCKAVKSSERGDASVYIRDTIIPKLGSKIAGYVWGNFSPNGYNAKWFLRYLAENTRADIVDMAREALGENGDSAAEIIEALGAYPDGGEEIVAQFAESDDSNILCAVVHSFAQMAELAKWDDAKFDSRIGPFAQNENSEVMDAAVEEILKRKKPVLDNAAFIELAASYTKSAKALEALAAVDAAALDQAGLAAYEKAVLAFADNQDDWSIRRDAVDLLVPFAAARWNAEKSGPVFAKFCEDNDSDVRYSALTGLVKTCASVWDVKAYVGVLCGFVAGNNYYSSRSIKIALDALIAEEPRLDAAAYKDALKTFVKNDSVHAKAAQALLAYSRDHDDEKTYLETAKLYVKDKNSALRQTVLDILIGASAEQNSAKCMTTFNAFTKDKDADIRRKAFELLYQKIKSENALAQFETLIKTFSADADRTTRARAFAVLADYGKAALDNAVYARALSNFAADRSGLGKSALLALKDGLLTKAQSAEDAAPYEAALAVFAKSGGRGYGEGIDTTAATILIAFGKEHWEDKRYEETLKDFIENCRSSTRSAALDALLEHALAKWPQEEYQELIRAYFKDDDDDARRLSLKSLAASGKEVWGDEYAAILTGFLEDDWSDICYTAAVELGKNDLAAWETFQLEALKAEEINTVTSLMTIPSAKVAAAIVDDARHILAANPDGTDKLWGLFDILAVRKEEAGVRFLDEVLSEEFFQNDSSPYNLQSVLKYLSVENTSVKNQALAAIVARASNAGVNLDTYFQLLAGSRTLSKETFFEQYQSLVCGDDGDDLIKIYRPKHGPTPDAKKPWDRRWAAALLENNISYTTAALFIFDDDEEAWEKLLDAAYPAEKQYITSLNNGSPSEEDASYADSLLARMFINKHPKADAYYRRLLDARYPKRLLDEVLSRLVPEWEAVSKG